MKERAEGHGGLNPVQRNIEQEDMKNKQTSRQCGSSLKCTSTIASKRLSHLVPSEEPSLEEAIRKENSWIRRPSTPPRSTTRAASRLATISNLNLRLGQNSSMEDDDLFALDAGPDILDNEDDFENEDDDEPRRNSNCILGLRTPRTLKSMKFKVSLAPVDEDEETSEYN